MNFRIAVCVIVACVASLAWAGTGPSVLIDFNVRQFQLNETPGGITEGPDGAMWFTEPNLPGIGRITTDGTVQSFPLSTTFFDDPFSITTGADGNLWFTDIERNAIGRMTVAGVATPFALPGNDNPGQIVLGSDGNLWFGSARLLSVAGGPEDSGAMGRITPNGTVSLFPTDFAPRGVTAGPDGALWFTSFERIGRMTTNGQDQYFNPGTNPAAHPVLITSGPDGALWFTAFCSDGPAGSILPCAGVRRITTSGQLTPFPQVNGNTGVDFIIRGPEDNLWFSRFDGRVSRMTPDGQVLDVLFNEDDPFINGMTYGPDGAIWLTYSNSSSIVKLGSVPLDFRQIADSGPLAMAPGLDGSVWFTDYEGERVGQMTRGGGLIQYELGINRGPTGIAAAPDGGAFFTNFNSGTIGRITADGDFVEYVLQPPDDLPQDIVLGPDGNFWFTIDDNAIGRITQQGVIKTFPLPTEFGGPQGITVGPDDNLWFTERLANRIGRMTTDGDAVDFPIPTAGSEPYDIAAGPDGALYFTEASLGRIARITVNGQVTELGPINRLASPRDIAAGPDGAMWYSIVPLRPTPPPIDVFAPPQRAADDPTATPTVTPTLGPARVGRLAPDGRITSFDLAREEIRPAIPAGVAGSEDGFLYVGLFDAARIVRLDLGGGNLGPTPTETLDVPINTPTPTQEPSEGTPTRTEEGSEGTPTPTEFGAPTGTETPEGGFTPTETETPEDGVTPTETETPDGEVTATPTESSTCAGDCDGDFSVSISELISAVNIALGNRSIDTCLAIDRDGDGEVRINELITAVSRALSGC